MLLFSSLIDLSSENKKINQEGFSEEEGVKYLQSTLKKWIEIKANVREWKVYSMQSIQTWGWY